MDIFDLFDSDGGNSNLKKEYSTDDLIKEGYISIPPFLWEHLNTIYDKHQIRTLLTDCVFNHKLEPPYKIYSDDELWKDFNSLKHRDISSLIGTEKWFSPKPLIDISDDEMTFQGNHYLIRGNNLGLTTSNAFSQSVRFQATNRDGKGIADTWAKYQTLYYVWNAIWSLKYDKVDRGVVRNCIRMKRYLPAQFKPNVARYLYELFGAKKVLDPSAGWGDRLSGFLASNCTEHYVGIDPNSKMHPCYRKQFDFYSQRVGGKRADFIHSPAEDVDLSEYKEYFDLVFTSPPYFDAERYTTEKTQSFARYDSAEKWLNGFMFPTLKKGWESLREGGVMIINIVDVYNDHNKGCYRICKPMLDFMATQPNCHYQGVIGYHMSVRPNRNQSFNSHFAERTPQAEPMWVWSKGEMGYNPFSDKEIWEM